MTEKQKVYFPNLNGLRFIAAFLVIIHHIEQIKSIYKMENYWETIPFIRIIGKLGVILFFVLSGFLITYLLLTEERSFKDISIKKFYIRRILRIWPLYFFIIILAFLVLPNINFFILPGHGKEIIYNNLILKLILYAVFLPNLVLSLSWVVPYASHTWSIGTEEQYYLVWPVLLTVFKKHRLALMGFIIFLYLGFMEFLASHYSDSIPYKSVITTFWSCFNIDCMAIGGFFAILLFQKNSLLKFLLNRFLFYAVIALTLILLIKGVNIPYVHTEFYSVLFGIIILNFAANQNIKISLENRILNYLGNISYGIYMYHPIGIVLALKTGLLVNCTTNWLLYPLSVLSTIIIAGLSYRYFESVFLKFKSRFSNVISGEETKG
jgi:peptidoglycan/LPS O-acetylase OafA/YrhL